MGTERSPSLMAAEDSSRTWRFEIDKELRMALGIPATFKGVAIHRTLHAVRPTTGDTAEVAFYTGGELGTTYEYSIKLETTGDLNLKAYGGGAFPSAINITPAGVVSLAAGSVLGAGSTINGCKILTGTVVEDMPNIVSGGVHTFPITVAGAVAGNSFVGVSANVALTAELILDGQVTSANTVTVRVTNLSAGGINETSKTFRATVFQF